MQQRKIISISTLAASLLVLAGCSSTPVATNTNLNTNVNASGSVNENTNNETNGVVNINAAVSDIRDNNWENYSNEKIGLKFDYPMPSNNMRFDYTNCSEVQCDSTTGSSYSLSFLDAETKMGYAVAGASTEEFSAGRDLAFFDVSMFKNNGGVYEAITSPDNSFVINPTTQKEYPNGKVVVYKIKELPSYPQLLDVMPERQNDQVAIYNFNKEIQGFKSISFLLTPEMNDQDIDRILSSVSFL